MISFVFGTRPEAIKIGSVVAALRAQRVPLHLVCTNQHTDLLAGSPAETDLLPARSMGIAANGDLDAWLRHADVALRGALQEADLIVVQGDTMSALAGARAGVALGIPVAHVEAGIRSGHLSDPWPEEGYRREISTLATWHYAPTARAFSNLLGTVPEDHISLTGNPVVSAIHRYGDVQPVAVPDLTVLFTMHRREWRAEGILGVLAGLGEAALTYPELRIVWPLHPAVARMLPPSWASSLPTNVQLTEPLAYRQALRLLARSLGVVTDSGGLQEEAATLGVPCAVIRRWTDRPESVEAGLARLFSPTALGVREGFRLIRDRTLPRRPCACFGQPDAAERIAQHLATVSECGDAARSDRRPAD